MFADGAERVAAVGVRGARPGYLSSLQGGGDLGMAWGGADVGSRGTPEAGRVQLPELEVVAREADLQ